MKKLALILSLSLAACAREKLQGPSPGSSLGDQNSTGTTPTETTSARWNQIDSKILSKKERDRLLSLAAFSKTREIPLQLRSLVAGEARESYTGKVAYAAALETTQAAPDASRMEASLEAIRKTHESIQDSYRMGAGILQGNQAIVKGSLQAGSILAGAGAGPLAQITLGAIEWGMSQGMDKIYAAYLNEANRSAEEFLGRKLYELTPEAWKEWDQLSSLSQEEASLRALELTQSWSIALNSKIHADDRAAVEATFHGFLTKAAIGQIAREGSLRALADRHQQAELDQNAEKIQAVAGTLVGFTRETNRQIQELQEIQSKIQGELHAIHEKVDDSRTDIQEISRGVNFLEDFTFGRMTPDEQLRALKLGAMNSVPENQRAELTRQIELVKKRQDFQNRAHDFLNGAQTLVQLGAKLGVSPQTLAVAQKAMAASHAGLQSFEAITTGSGYLGAVSALMQVFGGNGVDIGAERHSQLMDQLNRIAAGQSVLLEGVEDLRKGQALLLQGQLETFKKLNALSEQIRTTHDQVMNRLAELRKEVLYNRTMIRSLMLRDSWDCESFLLSRADYGKVSFSSMQEHFSDYSQVFHRCENGLLNNLENKQTSLISLDSLTYEVETSRYRNFVENIYAPTLQFSMSSSTLEAGRLKPFSMSAGLTLPSATTRHLESKLHTLRNDDRTVQIIPFDLQLLETPIRAQSLIQFSDWALKIVPYFDILEKSPGQSDYRLRSLDELLSSPVSPRHSMKGSRLLRSSMEWVRLAIAQESMLAGEGAIQKIFADFQSFSAETPPCETQKTHPICLLQSNPLLARNFLTYSFRKELEATNNSIVAYGLAYGLERDSAMLKMVTTKNWKFEWSPQNRWAVRIGSTLIDLPTPLELTEDKMRFRPEMEHLLQARERLASALATRDLQTSLTETAQRDLGWFMLYSH